MTYNDYLHAYWYLNVTQLRVPSSITYLFLQDPAPIHKLLLIWEEKSKQQGSLLTVASQVRPLVFSRCRASHLFVCFCFLFVRVNVCLFLTLCKIDSVQLRKILEFILWLLYTFIYRWILQLVVTTQAYVKQSCRDSSESMTNIRERCLRMLILSDYKTILPFINTEISLVDFQLRSISGYKGNNSSQTYYDPLS